eukprot:SAG25_NODE_7738_length_463_cov_0.667582_1_plen_108_part_10
MAKHIHIIISFCLFSSLETSVAEQVKNALLIVSDDLKASSLGCYGNKICKTPNLDRLAANGMVFERAYCQGTWCATSRISFMHSRFFKQKTAYEIMSGDWSSDVCSSD